MKAAVEPAANSATFRTPSPRCRFRPSRRPFAVARPPSPPVHRIRDRTLNANCPPSVTLGLLIEITAVSSLVIVPVAGLPTLDTFAAEIPLNVTVSVSANSTFVLAAVVASVIVFRSFAVPVKFSVPLADV